MALYEPGTMRVDGAEQKIAGLAIFRSISRFSLSHFPPSQLE